jgi:hypothetical protein
MPLHGEGRTLTIITLAVAIERLYLLKKSLRRGGISIISSGKWRTSPWKRCKGI